MNRFLILAAAALSAFPLVSKVFKGGVANHAAKSAVAKQAWGRRPNFGELKSVLTALVADVSKHNDSVLAAAVAFYALFALFPALAAATWIFGLIANPVSIQDQLDNLAEVLPREASQLIDQQLKALTSKSASLSFTGIMSLIIALYSARTAASSMMSALNVVYGVEDRRGFIKTNVIAILFTVVAILILLAAIAGMVAAPIVLGFVGLDTFASRIISIARWPVLAVIMILALAALYRYGPDRRRARWQWLTWGSATATAVWLAASFGFAWYVSAFNSYDKVYGSIGAVAVLLFWFWITAFSGILGAELDNVIERRRRPNPQPLRLQRRSI